MRPSQTIWFLHGAVGHPGHWNRTLEALGRPDDTLRVIDLYQYLDGQSQTFDEWAAAFNQEVVAAGTKRNVLIGYSLGGRLALHVLLAANHLWEAAIILCAHPGLRDDDERLRRMAADAEWAALALTLPWQQFLTRWDQQQILAVNQSEEEVNDIRLTLEPRRHAVARSFMDWSLGKQDDLREVLSEISCPLLWLTGEGDHKFTQLAEEALPLLPSGEHRTLADAGHRLLVDAPGGVADAILAFLNREEGEPLVPTRIEGG